MKVRVRFFGGFNGIPRDDEIQVPENTSVGVLLEKLAVKYGEPFRDQVLDADGRIMHFCKMFLVLEDGLDEVDAGDLGRPASGEVNFFSMHALGAG